MEGKPKRVLVVEDNLVNRELVVDLLEAAGYDVEQAEDGTQVLDFVKARRPDLILMDMQLPHVDGVTVTQALKADPATRDIPVIAVSAYAMNGDRERMLQAGCNGYIPKPVDTRRFLPTIATLLEGMEGPGEKGTKEHRDRGTEGPRDQVTEGHRD